MNVSNTPSTATLANTNLQNPLINDSRSADNTAKVRETEHSRHREEHHKGHENYHRDQNRGLGVFGNEIRQRLAAMFRVVVSAQLQAYSAADNGPKSDGVAAGVLGAAQKAVAQDPAASGQIISAIKGQVADAANVAAQTTAGDPGSTDVANTTDQINQGLDALATNTAQHTASSASVLSIDSASRQESTIRIRTQEGDTVKITLRQSSELSASAVSATDANGSVSGTQINLANGSSLSLSFEGDINDQELAAIQDVFKQAAVVANDFFGGDLAAAVQDAQGFQFDSSQLARVSLGFRSEQVTKAHFASVSTISGEQPAAPVSSTATPSVPDTSPVAAPSDAASDNTGDATTAEVQASQPSDTGGATASQPVQADTSGLAQLFDRISTFLRSVSNGFSGTDENKQSVHFHFTQSFKLDILKAVVQTVAPDAENGQLQDANAALDAYPTANDSNKDVAAQAA